MQQEHSVAERAEKLESRIRDACRAAGRSRSEIRMLAVSKARPADTIRRLAETGQSRFGENYVDEATAKQDQLSGLDLEWHFIGPVQSNKTRALAERFDWIQSVDRAKIIRRLDEQRPDHMPPLNVLVQVNVDNETRKSGCDDSEIAGLAAAVEESRSLRLRGLMAIPSAENSPADMRAAFATMRGLFESLQATIPHIDTLSMGMSSDLEAAIAEGSSMVRVGTDLFGPSGPR